MLLALPLLLASASTAFADGISGFVEFSNSVANSRSRVGEGAAESVRSDSLSQRYSLTLGQALYPLLRVAAGTLFEKTDSDVTAGSIESNSTATQFSPYIWFTMGGDTLNSSVGYSRNEMTASTSGGAGRTTEIFENYNARMSLRPHGLPTLSLLLSRSNSFDEHREARDTTSDFYSLGSRYQPNPNLSLNYSGSIADSSNHLSGFESRSISNTFRGDYTRPFYDKRVNFFASGTVNSQMRESSGSGTALEELLPVAGYFAVNEVATFLPLSQWQSLPGLISGRDDATAINLGPTPPGEDPGPRQMGLDFGAAPDLNRRGVNTIHVYVPLQNGVALPPSVTGLFTWDVYSSTDNENWNPVAVGLQAGFETDNDPQLGGGLNVSRFVISFPTVFVNDPASPAGSRIQFLKVVVRPLPVGSLTPDPRIDLTKIVVNKIEAFSQGTVQSQKSSSISALLDTMVRVRVYESKRSSVLYNLNMNYNQSSPDQGVSTYSYFVSSGISGTYRFNSFLSGNGRVVAEQAGQTGGDARNSYSYSASLQAVPLTTLRHNLVVSGRYATSPAGSSSSSSFFLSNTAQLYRGLSASLTGGLSLTQNEDGSEGESTFLSAGMNVVPHRKVSVNMSYAETRSHISGGARVEVAGFNRTVNLSASYNPIGAVLVFASVGYSAQNEREDVVTQSFGANWSPFREGDLQLNTAYSESLTSASDEKVSTLSASLRYNIRQGWWLDSTYGLQNTESTVNTRTETRIESLSTTLRLNF